MQISPGTQLVWSLSGSEAVNLGMPKIEPDHLFCALLKFSELDDATISRLLKDSGDLSAVAKERDDLAKELENLSGSITEIRRAVRKEAERGTHKLEGNLIHRSDMSRKIFELAIKKAVSEGEPVYPTHLYQVIMDDPTPAMKKVVKTKMEMPGWLLELEEKDEKPSAPDLAYSWVQEILDQAPKKGFTIKENSKPQIKIIELALQASVPSPILLICEKGVQAPPLIWKAADNLKDSFSLFSADHEKMFSSMAELDEAEMTAKEIAKVVDEVLEKDNTWLFFDLTGGTAVDESALLDLQPLLLKQTRLVVAVAEKLYESNVKTDESTEASVRFIWLHNLTGDHSVSRI